MEICDANLQMKMSMNRSGEIVPECEVSTAIPVVRVGNGMKRLRGGLHDSSVIRRSTAEGLHFTSEVLADIGVFPLNDDDCHSSDTENESPHLSKSVDLAAFWAAEPLGPTPSVANMPLRVVQTDNSNTPLLPIRNGFQLRKRQRLMSSVTDGREDLFRNISDEIFLQIFQWLPKSTLKQCARVCKRWRRLSYDESLWKFLDLAGRKLSLSTLMHILQRGVIVMRLARADIGMTAPQDTIKTERSLFKAQYLDLSMAAISVSALETLLSGCGSLKKLSLEHCELSVKVCQLIARNTNLVELNLSLCSGLDKQGLREILHGCENLKALNLAWAALTEECVSFGVCNFPFTLTHLNLSGCRESLNNDDVEDLCDTCPRLEVLDLSDAVQLTANAVKLLARSLTGLRELHMSRCYNIYPDVYCTLGGMPSLTELNVFGLFDAAGVEIIKNRLQNISVNVSPFSTVARPTTGIRRTSIWTLREMASNMLDFQNELFLDVMNEDALVVMAKGLGLDDIVTSLLKVHCDPGNLVLVIGTYAKEEEYFVERLLNDEVQCLPKILTAKCSTNDRKQLYLDGGVVFVTSRILVVDFLTGRIPVEHVTGIVVLKAHKVLDYCQEAFILRLYREKNKTGFVKAFSSNVCAFTRGFCQVERVMRNLFVRRLLLLPRFHAMVSAGLETTSPETIEVQLSLTPAMLAIQTALLDMITISVRELKKCNPSLDLEEVSTESAMSKAFDKIVRHQLDTIWNQLSRKTKQLISDLKQLRSILFQLTQYDCVSFFNSIENLKSSKDVNSSGWLFLPPAQTIFSCARDRLQCSDSTESKQRKKMKKIVSAMLEDDFLFAKPVDDLVFEDNAKWSALQEILVEIKQSVESAGFPLEAGNTLIVTADERTCKHLQEFLRCGSRNLLTRLYKKFVLKTNTKEVADNASPAADDKSEQTKGMDNMEEFIRDMVVVQSLKNDGGLFTMLKYLRERRPRYIVVYDAEITFVRQLEVYQANNTDIPVVAYLLFYKGSAEEQLYLNVLRREKEAFEMLIRQKASMVIPEEQDGRGDNNALFDRDAVKANETVNSLNSRRGGHASDRNSSKVKQKIIVDMREFQSELPCLIHARGIDVEPVTLEVGDYILTPEICVERKSIDDLIGSLNNGRLFSQATAMCRYYKRPMLLIEFDLEKPFSLQGKQHSFSEISSQDFQTKLLMLTMHFPRLKILWCSSPYAAAEIFKEIKADKAQPSAEQAAAVTEAISAETGIDANVGKYNSSPKDCLMLMPGVDSKNCRTLLMNTSSLAELANNWTQKQLQQLLGNSDTAKTLWESMHTPLKQPKTAKPEYQGKRFGGYKGKIYKPASKRAE